MRLSRNQYLSIYPPPHIKKIIKKKKINDSPLWDYSILTLFSIVYLDSPPPTYVKGTIPRSDQVVDYAVQYLNHGHNDEGTSCTTNQAEKSEKVGENMSTQALRGETVSVPAS